MRKYKILSIDGGGIRGIIAAKLLAEIEKETKKPIHSLFNLVAGTSTGGILALGVTKPEPKSAEEMLEIYRTKGKEIFSVERRSPEDKRLQRIAGILSGVAVLAATQWAPNIILQYSPPWLIFMAVAKIFLKRSPSLPLRNIAALPIKDSFLFSLKGWLLLGSLAAGFNFGLGKDEELIKKSFLMGGGIGGLIFNLLDAKGGDLFDMIKYYIFLFHYYTFTIVMQRALRSLLSNTQEHSDSDSNSYSSYMLKRMFRETAGAILAVTIIGLHGTNMSLKDTMIKSSAYFLVAYMLSPIIKRSIPFLFPKYSRKGLDDILKAAFIKQDGNQPVLKEALTDVLITSYDIQARGVSFFFKTPDERKETKGDHKEIKNDPKKIKIDPKEQKMWDVAGATSAAPTFFPPKKIGDKVYIDGGIVVNNPELCAYALAKRSGYKDEEIYVVSIGTGECKRESLNKDSLRTRGKLEWITDAIEIQSESAVLSSHLMRAILPKDHYVRLQVGLPGAIELDEVHEHTIETLENSASQYIKKRPKEMTDAISISLSR